MKTSKDSFDFYISTKMNKSFHTNANVSSGMNKFVPIHTFSIKYKYEQNSEVHKL